MPGLKKPEGDEDSRKADKMYFNHLEDEAGVRKGNLKLGGATMTEEGLQQRVGKLCPWTCTNKTRVLTELDTAIAVIKEILSLTGTQCKECQRAVLKALDSESDYDKEGREAYEEACAEEAKKPCV